MCHLTHNDSFPFNIILLIFGLLAFQGLNAFDAGGPDHHGENTQLFCDEQCSEAHPHNGEGHQTDHRGAQPSDPSHFRLHTDAVQTARDPHVRSPRFQEPDTGSNRRVMERAAYRHLCATPRKLAPVFSPVTDALCEWRAAHHRSSRRNDQGAGLPGSQAHRHRQALLLQQDQRLPLPEEA